MSDEPQTMNKSVRLILDKDGVKREITGPFHLLIDNYTFEIIKNAFEANVTPEGFFYGWLTIHDPVHCPLSINAPPLKWTEAEGGAP